jgi:hypothetical protein
MLIETGSTEELVRLAGSGVGLRVEAGQRPTEELVKIARAARTNGGCVTFFGMQPRPLRELLKIVEAGGLWQGRVASVERSY